MSSMSNAKLDSNSPELEMLSKLTSDKMVRKRMWKMVARRKIELKISRKYNLSERFCSRVSMPSCTALLLKRAKSPLRSRNWN